MDGLRRVCLWKEKGELHRDQGVLLEKGGTQRHRNLPFYMKRSPGEGNQIVRRLWYKKGNGGIMLLVGQVLLKKQSTRRDGEGIMEGDQGARTERDRRPRGKTSDEPGKDFLKGGQERQGLYEAISMGKRAGESLYRPGRNKGIVLPMFLG